MTDLGEYFNYVVPMTGEQMIKYQTNLTAVSLFAGVGGFDLAMERNGINVVASVEIDKHAAGILAKRFPKSTILNDVQKVSGNELRSAGFIPDRGILTGGFPCQDLSVAGKRAGLAGARSGLYWEIVRIIEETGPEWVVLENVPGLLSSNNGNDFGVVIGALVDRGYGVSWRVLDAQNFGVPQRRRRVFIVARRAGDTASCAKVLFERTSVRGNNTQGRAQGQEVAADAGTGAAIGFSHTQGLDAQPSTAYFPTLRVGGGGHAVSYEIEPRAFVKVIRAGARDEDGNLPPEVSPLIFQAHQSGDVRVQGKTTHTLSAFMGTGGNNTPLLAEPQTFVKVIRSGARDAEGNLPPEVWREEETNPTINQFDQGDKRTVVAIVESEVAYANPVASTVRRLTPMECERLQGFPDGWTEGQADSHRYKQMGNAVAVPVVEWIMQGIVEVMNNE